MSAARIATALCASIVSQSATAQGPVVVPVTVSTSFYLLPECGGGFPAVNIGVPWSMENTSWAVVEKSEVSPDVSISTVRAYEQLGNSQVLLKANAFFSTSFGSTIQGNCALSGPPVPGQLQGGFAGIGQEVGPLTLFPFDGILDYAGPSAVQVQLSAQNSWVAELMGNFAGPLAFKVNPGVGLNITSAASGLPCGCSYAVQAVDPFVTFGTVTVKKTIRLSLGVGANNWPGSPNVQKLGFGIPSDFAAAAAGDAATLSGLSVVYDSGAFSGPAFIVIGAGYLQAQHLTSGLGVDLSQVALISSINNTSASGGSITYSSLGIQPGTSATIQLAILDLDALILRFSNCFRYSQP
jgi:hypothetical protein